MENRDFNRHPSAEQVFVGVHTLSDHSQFYAEYKSTDKEIDKFMLSYRDKKVIISSTCVEESLASDVINHPEKCQRVKVLCGNRYISAVNDTVIVYKYDYDIIKIPKDEFANIMRVSAQCIASINHDIEEMAKNETSVMADRRYQVYHMSTNVWVFLETYIVELLLPIVMKKMFCAASWGLGFGRNLCSETTDNFDSAIYALAENIGGRRHFCFERAIGTIIPEELEARRGYIFDEFDFCPSNEWIIKEASDLYRPMLAKFTQDVIGDRQSEIIFESMGGGAGGGGGHPICQAQNDSIALVLDIARHIPCECETVAQM